MKKILLALLLVLTMIPVTASAETEFTDVSDSVLGRALGLVTHLDIMSGYDDDTFRGDNSITRAEFAVSVAHMLNLEEQAGKDKIYYVDVQESHWAAGSIAQLTEMGIISGYGNGYFGVNDTINTVDCYAIMLRLLGYDDFVEYSGGYPSGVQKIANDIELNEDIKSGIQLKRRDAAVLIFNALRTNTAGFDGVIGDNVIYTEGTGKTLLETYWDMDWVEGKVTGVENTGLYHPESISSNRIRIDDEIYGNEVEDTIQYIGRNVEAYYKINDDDPCVVYIYKNAHRYEEITIDADLIADISDNYEVSYYTDENASRTKKKTIAGNAAVIYNGLAAESYTKENLMPEVGSITLIFDKGNSTADTVIVDDYERFIAGSVDVITSRISNAETYDRYIIAKNTEYEKVTVKSNLGTNMTLSDIKENQVLMVKTSLGTGKERIIEIIACDDVVTGTVNGINYSNEEIEIDGTVYEISPQYIDMMNVNLSKNVIAYLDHFGKITNIKGDVADSELFGYLINGYFDEDAFDETIYLKILTEDGEIVKYPCTEKVKIDNIRYKRNLSGAFNALCDGESIKPQLIVYMLNEEKQIYSIDTVTKSAEEDEFSLRLNISKGKYKYKSNGQIGGKGIANKNTIVFEIPTNPQDAQEKAFSVKKSTSLTNNTAITVESYALVPKVEYETVLLVYSDAAGTIRESASSVMVQKIHHAINSDEEVVEVLTAMTNGVSSEYYAEYGFSFEETGIKEGDVIRLAFNNIDEVCNIEKVITLGETPSWSPTNDTNSIDAGFKKTFGYATEKAGNVLRIGYEADGEWDEVYVMPSKITIYDSQESGRFCVYEGTIDDISTYEYSAGACDQVYIHVKNSAVQSVFVYKK